MLAYSMSSDGDDEFEDPNHHNPRAQGVTIPNSFSPPHTGFFSQASSSGYGGNPSTGYDLERARSASLSMRVRDAGGVNSITNFARSWQRAAAFPEVIPRRSSSVAIDSDDDLIASIHDASSRRASQLHDPDADPLRPKLVETDDEHGLNDRGVSRNGLPFSSILGSSLDQTLGASYGTISSRVSQSTRKLAIQLHREQQALGDVSVSGEAEPLLLKQVQHEDGTRESIVIGQSTVPQTIFNSVNVLIGVGLLSLPLAMKQAGWLLGLLFLFFAAVSTSYTAKILAKCLDVDRSLVTYADLAYISFGHHARLVTSLLFCLELIGACVALVVLFADSLHVLVPAVSILQWKAICGLTLIPLSFVPLRLLSVTSILGILSCTSSMIFSQTHWLLNE
ncbi:hypothetical protein FE257_003384 [Aspergillus nanangensis]|uniref:Amino acid transporter transmembrane domain-containing protein n=1 Tax=Aspergillus nanangensis TaxID=2582783 RepID=A0AAD4CBP1_ASPNN|nr:hypothetical protein FE257_003384 [Aspergillus nanangensis]